ncbi:hypothetical protein LTR09_009558 [Extremus antarcticus]|uniref:Uncharacterized protein n=1 Tax=Extremus antarcticus TaxID=702011 RepID=A0AAJ0G951_9PEZI|nr:hypothetical protein LTR09_009558 [Extremus antarcticus]
MASKRTKPSSSQQKKPSGSQHPSPFTLAPASTSPLQPQLDPSLIYITHIDRHRPAYKKQIYTFAIAVNGTIALLLLWRLYVAVPKYLALIQTILGYVTRETVDTATTTRKEQIWVLAKRVSMMAMDYALVQFVVPWPVTFFAEQPANPVTWRWHVPFQLQEVVVRVSRGWGAEELLHGTMEFLQKTGYLMMGSHFDLDFGLMQDAHTLVKEGKMKLDDFDRMVLVHQEGGGWLAYRFGTQGDYVEENRKRMMAFRELLQGMGKESLFWKWQEIVEEERQKDGEMTAETQRRVAERVGKVFEEKGVDFQEAMARVGEVEALPGAST